MYTDDWKRPQPQGWYPMSNLIDINQHKDIESWQTPRSLITREIEHNTKAIGEMIVKDFETNNNLTEDCVYAILPIVSQIIAKKQARPNYETTF
jgi:hypothetical protein